jgi:hypothetical protein
LDRGREQSFRAACLAFKAAGYLALVASAVWLVATFGLTGLTMHQMGYLQPVETALICLAWVYALSGGIEGIGRGWAVAAIAARLASPVLLLLPAGMPSVLASSLLVLIGPELETVLRCRWLLAASARLPSRRLQLWQWIALAFAVVKTLMLFGGSQRLLALGMPAAAAIGFAITALATVPGLVALRALRAKRQDAPSAADGAEPVVSMSSGAFQRVTAAAVAVAAVVTIVGIRANDPERVAPQVERIVSDDVKDAYVDSLEARFGKVDRRPATAKATEAACKRGDLNLCIIRGWIAAYDGLQAAGRWYVKACRPTFRRGCEAAKHVPTDGSAVLEPPEPQAPDGAEVARLRTRMDNMAAALWQWRAVHQGRPGKLDLLVGEPSTATVMPVEPEFLTDPWGQRIRYRQLAVSDRLISSGPDGKAGTRDDIEAWTDFESVFPRYTQPKERRHRELAAKPAPVATASPAAKTEDGVAQPPQQAPRHPPAHRAADLSPP